MSDEIAIGSILGGRYLVTGEVVSTAEGDVVFDGTDQVLNREVSILVAAPSNATRVAVSAREVAMGTRPSDVQVLDLGLQGDSTYLITNTIDAPELLDLAVEAQAPYIEPFQTDTLGQEIFGEPRAMEPQVYQDDAEYYEELAQESNRKRRFGRKNKKRQQEAAAEPVEDAGPVEPEAGTAEHPAVPPVVSPDQAQAELGPETGPFAAQPMAASEAAKAYPHEDRDTESDEANEAGVAAAASGPAVTELPPSGNDAQQRSTGSRFPREAAAAAAAAADDPTTGGFVAASGNDDGGNRVVRLVVGLVLVIVLILAVVFAVQFLSKSGDDKPAPAASSSQKAEPKSSSGKPSSKSPSPSSEAPKTEPEVEGITRALPDTPMNDQADSDLNNAIDDQASTLYKTYSYKSPVFGGFTDQMVLAVKLKEKADVSSVELSGLNGTGGKVQILVGDSEDPGAAQERFSGSFSGPTLSADVGSDDKSSQGEYVFISITELPRLASGESTYPYGFQVGEITVK